MSTLLKWEEGLTIAKEQMMEIKRAQITPRRGVATLLKNTRALMVARNITSVAFAEQSGVSAPVAGRIKNGSLTTIAKKTECRLKQWLADNTQVSPLPEPPEPKLELRGAVTDAEWDKQVIAKLEKEVSTKDHLLRAYTDMNKKQEKTIKKLKRQRDKLIGML